MANQLNLFEFLPDNSENIRVIRYHASPNYIQTSSWLV